MRAPAGPPDRVTPALWVAGMGAFAFIYLPLVVVIVYAFHDSPIIAWPLQLGTLRWFTALAHDRGMIVAALASLKLALLAVAIALLVGVPGAFVLDRHRFPTQVEARMAVFDFIEGWYNPRRRYSALDYESPLEYERSALELASAESP